MKTRNKNVLFLCPPFANNYFFSGQCLPVWNARPKGKRGLFQNATRQSVKLDIWKWTSKFQSFQFSLHTKWFLRPAQRIFCSSKPSPLVVHHTVAWCNNNASDWFSDALRPQKLFGLLGKGEEGEEGGWGLVLVVVEVGRGEEGMRAQVYLPFEACVL